MIPSDDLEKYLVDLNDHGGPAFPVLVPENVEGFVSLGMSLRDYFAAKAMAAAVRNKGLHYHDTEQQAATCKEQTARRAYEMADAMLVARKAIKES